MEHVCDCTPPQGHSQPNCPIHGEAAAAIEIRDRSLAIAAALDVDRAMPWRELVEVVRATRIKRDQVIAQLEHMAKELNAQHGEPIQDALERETNAIHRTRAEVLRKFEIACGYDSTCTSIEAAIDDVCSTVEAQRGQARPLGSDEHTLRIAYLLGCERVPMSELGANVVGVLEHMAKELNAQHGEPIQDALERETNAIHRTRAEVLRKFEIACGYSSTCTNIEAAIDDVCAVVSSAFGEQSDAANEAKMRMQVANVLGLIGVHPDDEDVSPPTWDTLIAHAKALHQSRPFSPEHTLAHERLDELEKRVDEDRVAQYAFDEFKAAVETWQAAHAQTVANLAKNVASIDLAFGGLAAAMTTGRDAVSDWQKKVDETVRQFGEAGNLLRGDVAALTEKVDGIASNANKALVGLAQSNAETTNNRFVELAKRIDTLEANSWHRVGDGAFGPPFGTLRVCVDCGAIVAGGPTRCVRCATDGELIAELGTKTDAIVRRADSGAEALVQLGVLVSELRAKIDRIDERTRTPGVRSDGAFGPIPLKFTTALVTCARDVVAETHAHAHMVPPILRRRIEELERALANFERNTKAGS